MTLSAYLLDIVRKAGERPEPAELYERIRARTPVEPAESPAEAVRAEREGR